MSPLPLEDNLEDIWQKSCAGWQLTARDLQDRSGLPAEAIARTLRGQGSAEEIRVLAPLVGLSAEKLIQLAQGLSYRQTVLPPAGLAMFTTRFGGMAVNNYLVWEAGTGRAAIFDTGADADKLLEFVRQNHLQVGDLFLTHAHGDHIFELDRLREKTGAQAWIGEREALEGATPFPAGKSFAIGRLAIETRLTWGHSPGGISYIISGLETPVAIVGDAIFAGSIGGGKVSFADALRTIREELLVLPPETLLCPGHGPLTTVAQELADNPFF